jgi:hypothetical protein
MLGSRNGSALIKSGQKWEILNESKLYPEIKKMPKAGIENIRAVARARKQKKNHTSTLTGWKQNIQAGLVEFSNLDCEGCLLPKSCWSGYQEIFDHWF